MRRMVGWSVVVAVSSWAVLLLVGAWLDLQPRQEIDARYESGTHLLLVFTAPWTAPDAEVVRIVRDAKARAREVAEERGLLLATIGIATHRTLAAGTAALEPFGPFDEVIIGRSWLNSGVSYYLRQEGVTAAMPQLSILVQHVDLSLPRPEIARPEILTQIVGNGGFVEWDQAGIPVAAALDGATP